MRLLFDQNLSWKLVRLLADVYEGCAHVRDLGMADATDTVIWAYAAEHGFTVVTKDSDFLQRSLRLGKLQLSCCERNTFACTTSMPIPMLPY